jgi:hypothetical protein
VSRRAAIAFFNSIFLGEIASGNGAKTVACGFGLVCMT